MQLSEVVFPGSVLRKGLCTAGLPHSVCVLLRGHAWAPASETAW